MKKSYIAAALALTSCMVVGTAAASQSNSVTATFRPDVTLKVNGTAYTVRDTTGVKVSPLIYNGTTYLPLSSLGQLLGAEVSWDNDSQTVIIHDDDADYIGEGQSQGTGPEARRTLQQGGLLPPAEAGLGRRQSGL